MSHHRRRIRHSRCELCCWRLNMVGQPAPPHPLHPHCHLITTKIRGDIFCGKTCMWSMLIISSSNDWFHLLFQLRAAQFVLHFTSLLLCWSSSLGEQQRAYLMSAALLWLPKAVLFFFPKQRRICCQALHIPVSQAFMFIVWNM